MFVTKKGSNLRRPTGKMRNNVLIPAAIRDGIITDDGAVKTLCKKRGTIRKNDKEETSE